jgi:hypothetical protein
MLELLLKIQFSVSKFYNLLSRTTQEKKIDALDMTARPPTMCPGTRHCTAAQRAIASIHKAMAKTASQATTGESTSD